MTFSGRTYLAASRTRALCFQPMLLKTRYKARQSRASGDRSHGAFIWSDRRKFARQSLIKRTAFDIFTRNWCLQNSPGYLFFDALGRVMSSYQLDRMNTNPLGEFTVKAVYFECVRKCYSTKLFILATNVETGKVQVFDPASLTADIVMASACLSIVFQAIEIDGMPYWGGAYMGVFVHFRDLGRAMTPMKVPLWTRQPEDSWLIFKPSR